MPFCKYSEEEVHGTRILITLPAFYLEIEMPLAWTPHFSHQLATVFKVSTVAHRVEAVISL